MFEPMIALSTAHLKEETCNEYLGSGELAAYEKGEFGWFVYVPDDRPDDLPTELADIFDKAAPWGFQWVMFDRDASTVNDLAVFDW